MESFAAIYLPQLDVIFLFDESEQNEASLYIENFGTSKRICFKSRQEETFPNFKLKNSRLESVSEDIYLHWVQECIAQIQIGEFTKLVAAQYQVESIHGEIDDYLQLMRKLIWHLPDTFVYLFFIDGEIWLGASPEMIGIYENKIFKTISIAGTKKEEDFTEKEIEEQAIVSKYISSHFAAASLKQDSTTKVQHFGDIRHLINEYEYNVGDEFEFEKAIHTIHPSPALAGYPKEISIDFINKNEPIQRDFYCGLASLSIQENKYSFATIRCARISANQIAYYAGAGITKDSDPASEWRETLEKIGVLKRAIFSL
ncbi:MAG: chorismate-binding protein [Chitinophagales bacterium]|nr:chorismate-binding protein [Chitinophagales bacterium]